MNIRLQNSPATPATTKFKTPMYVYMYGIYSRIRSNSKPSSLGNGKYQDSGKVQRPGWWIGKIQVGGLAHYGPTFCGPFLVGACWPSDTMQCLESVLATSFSSWLRMGEGCSSRHPPHWHLWRWSKGCHQIWSYQSNWNMVQFRLVEAKECQSKSLPIVFDTRTSVVETLYIECGDA